MSYKWTVEEVDRLSWPQLMSLKAQILSRPPHDVVVGWAEQEQQEPSTLGVPIKKGKVKRRKHGD